MFKDCKKRKRGMWSKKLLEMEGPSQYAFS